MGKIVIKVGTHLLTKEDGSLNNDYISDLTKQISQIHSQGNEVVLVTSGAIRCGMEKLNFCKELKTIPEKQALASIGQGLLIEAYTKCFSNYNKIVGQILLTREDVIERNKYLNARNTFLTLFQYRAIPIVNENDTVAVEEIQFGDNDNLSAFVASLIEADLLILLTDVDGLYTADPRENKTAKKILEVKKIDENLEKIAEDSKTIGGTGGMKTKIEAAKIATFSGVKVIIANGTKKNILQDLIDGRKIGTIFNPQEKKLSLRKCWIAFNLPSKGVIKVNEGAKKMITEKGKSLLPVGIINVEGDFKIDDMVILIGEDSKEFARGLVNYSCLEIEKIKGTSSKEILSILGYKYSDEVIHRDNLAVL